jgi:hypothetical protein
MQTARTLTRGMPKRRSKRINPAATPRHSAYWPRIYLMDENQDAKSVNAINYPAWTTMTTVFTRWGPI